MAMVASKEDVEEQTLEKELYCLLLLPATGLK